MDLKATIDIVKSSFCNLTSFKLHRNSVEVITPYVTMNSKFVSVFVTYTNEKIVVTDNGWLELNYYEVDAIEDYDDILDRVKATHVKAFNLKSTRDQYGAEFLYKVCKNQDQIPSAILDVASCIVGIVNSHCIHYKDENETKERDRFKGDVNEFFKINFPKKVKFRHPLDDLKSIKFNAIVESRNEIHLITYITGATRNYYENDIRKSIVNFEISHKSKFNRIIKSRISIINNSSAAYTDLKSPLLEHLSLKSSRPPILWEEKEKIFQIIS